MGLFIAVTLVYLFTWYTTNDPISSQTVAFFGWLIGQVMLVFNLRSERQSIIQLGLTANRRMLIWAAAVVLFLIAISSIPGAQSLMKITTPSAAQWGMVLGTPFFGTFWILKKLIVVKKE